MKFPKTIFLIGTGGTGAEILRRLRHIFPEQYIGKGKIDVSECEVVIIDHDLVELKNCWRQDFFFWDIGEYKVEALFKRYRDFLKIKAIPEALNRETLPLIFSEERISNDFLVISAVDHTLTASQIYFWLRAHAPRTEDVSWAYILVGGQIKKGKFSNLSEVESYHVTSFLWGYQKGKPLTQYEPHNLTTILKDPGDVLGRRSDGTYGCGMAPPEDQSLQTSLMNYESANHVCLHIQYLYFQNIVIPVINTEFGKRDFGLLEVLEGNDEDCC